MSKPYQSPGRMKNSSYYIAPVGDRTHDLPHTVASNMVQALKLTIRDFIQPQHDDPAQTGLSTL